MQGFELSRQNTAIKLSKLVEKMEKNGLWLTYMTAENAEEGFRTPRGRNNNAENFLKRGSRT